MEKPGARTGIADETAAYKQGKYKLCGLQKETELRAAEIYAGLLYKNSTGGRSIQKITLDIFTILWKIIHLALTMKVNRCSIKPQ